MRNNLVRVLAIFVVLALAASLTGCACSSTQTETGAPAVQPVPTETIEPTQTEEPTEPAEPQVSSGQIVTPASGTAARTAILKAVAKGLGVSGTPTVHQLYVQGIAAVGDIKPASGSRTFFALTGGAGKWKLAWSAPFGSTLASVEKLLEDAPEVSPELAAKLDFAKVVTQTKAPSTASFKAFVLQSAQSMAEGTYDGTFTVVARIAQDSSGQWWGNGVAEPEDMSYEPIGIFGRYKNGKWTGEVADYSDDDPEGAFFPADVVDKLRL